MIDYMKLFEYACDMKTALTQTLQYTKKIFGLEKELFLLVTLLSYDPIYYYCGGGGVCVEPVLTCGSDWGTG